MAVHLVLVREEEVAVDLVDEHLRRKRQAWGGVSDWMDKRVRRGQVAAFFRWGSAKKKAVCVIMPTPHTHRLLSSYRHTSKQMLGLTACARVTTSTSRARASYCVCSSCYFR